MISKECNAKTNKALVFKAQHPIGSVSLALHTRDVPRHVSPLPPACVLARQHVVLIDSRARVSLHQCRQRQQAHALLKQALAPAMVAAPIVPQLIRVNDSEAAALFCHNVAVSVCKLDQEEVGPRRKACEGQEAALGAVACGGCAQKLAVEVEQHMRRVSHDASAGGNKCTHPVLVAAAA